MAAVNPVTRYAKSGDVNIAYQVIGDGLTVLVLLIEAVLCVYQGFRGQWIWVQ